MDTVTKYEIYVLLRHDVPRSFLENVLFRIFDTKFNRKVYKLEEEYEDYLNNSNFEMANNVLESFKKIGFERYAKIINWDFN